MKLFNRERKFFSTDESNTGGSFLDEIGEGITDSETEKDFDDDIDFAKISVEEEVVEDISNKEEVIPAEEANKEVSPEPKEESSELEEIKKQNALLIERLNSLQEQINNKTAVKEESVKQEEVQNKDTETIDIFGGQDFDEVLSDKNKFIGMLANYGKVIMQETFKTIAVQLPNVVNEQVVYQTKTKEMADEFYRVNSDLANVRPTVSAVMQSVIAENPGMDMTNILSKTAEKTRELLGIKSKIDNVSGTSSIPPTAPLSSSKRAGTVIKRMEVSDEIEALKNMGF